MEMDKYPMQLNEDQLIKFLENTIAGLKSGEIVWAKNLMLDYCSFNDPTPYMNYALEFHAKKNKIREMIDLSS